MTSGALFAAPVIPRIFALLSFCIASSALAQPISVTDALGRAVVLPSPPQRIVTIFSSNVELVAALGLTDRIVGVEAYTRYPAAVIGKPLVGGRLGFSVDAVIAQRPDLVIVTPARQAASQLVDPMERLGVPIMVLLSRRVPEIFANIRLVARAAGVPERGEEVASALEARLARVAAQFGDAPRPRVVMVRGRIGNGLLLVAQDKTYTADAIVLAGGRPALSGLDTIPQVSPEAILASDPDVLLFAGSQSELEDLVTRPGWAQMRAVREGRAHVVARAEFLIPGPRTIDGIEKLAALLRTGPAH